MTFLNLSVKEACGWVEPEAWDSQKSEAEFQSGSILRVEKSGQLAPLFSSPGATHPQRGWELPGMF